MRVAAFEGAAGAGLVPSINNGETPLESFKVEHLQARMTRFRKNLGVAAKLLSKGAGQAWMLTFTYRDSVEWGADHIKTALMHLRKWLARAYGWRMRYVWVMEAKPRLSGERVGEYRPHYHCIVWLPREVTKQELFLDARGWWPHGMTNALQAVAPVRYVMKYASKFDHAEAFPKGARCYGVGGLDVVDRGCRRWINWPSFVQARAAITDAWRRVRGGGWVDPHGEIWPSEFGLAAIGKGYTRVVRLLTHPPGPCAGAEGPFSWLPAFAGHAE